MQLDENRNRLGNFDVGTPMYEIWELVMKVVGSFKKHVESSAFSSRVTLAFTLVETA